MAGLFRAFESLRAEQVGAVRRFGIVGRGRRDEGVFVIGLVAGGDAGLVVRPRLDGRLALAPHRSAHGVAGGARTFQDGAALTCAGGEQA